MKEKIVICGGGIGGLTTAHELATKGYEVHIYERHSSVGGMARSMYHKTNEHSYPVEYSWRVYGSGYKNLLQILKEIPQTQDTTRTIKENLVAIVSYVFPRTNHKEFIVGGNHATKNKQLSLTKKDRLLILHKILTCLTMCTKRMDAMDHMKWSDYCNNLSDEARKYVVTMWGPALGMDPTHMSFPVVARFMGALVAGILNKVSPLYLLNAPTNDAWFDQWAQFLELNHNVSIHTSHRIDDFVIEDGEIKQIRVCNLESGEEKVVAGDEFVCALPAEVSAELLGEHQKLQTQPYFANLRKLAKIGHQIQLSVQIFLNEKVSYPTKENLVLYLPDTPWAIIIEPEAKIWGSTHCSDPRVKSVWSVGICQTDTPGITHKKPFTQCTPKEIEEEVLAQIQKSFESSSIRMENNEPLNQSHIVLFYMWDSFQFDKESKKITTKEPKFSNNAGTLQYQPNTTTPVKNLTFATAYTRTDRFIFSMEAAAEAGIHCANHLLLKMEGRKAKIKKTFCFKHSHWILSPLLWLDSILYKLRIPHMGKLLGHAAMPVAIYFLLLLFTLYSSLLLLSKLI